MIIILCDTYDDALAAFNLFCSFLDRYEPMSIVENDEYSLRVITDDDLIYIFIKYNMKGVFDNEEADFVEVDEFFEDMYNHYDADVFEDFQYGWFPW